MENFRKKSLMASIAVTSVNIAILFTIHSIMEITTNNLDYINKIYIPFIIAFAIAIFIEVFLLTMRMHKGISIRNQLLTGKNEAPPPSKLDFMGMWWAFSTWIFPLILYRLILWKYNFNGGSQLSSGGSSFHLGNLIVPYIALRTFIEWQVYRKSLDPKLP